MGFKNALLVAASLPVLIKCTGLDFSSLAPSVPPIQLNSFNETTGYPNKGNIFYLDEDEEIFDFKGIAFNYLEETYPNLTFEINSIIDSEDYYFTTINLVQTIDNNKINNSFITINIDSNTGEIFNISKYIWEDTSFKEYEMGINNAEKEISEGLRSINKAFSLSEENDWEEVILKVNDEEYSIEGIPFSDIVVARKIYTIQNEVNYPVWEFTFLYGGVYNTISYDYLKKKIINGFENRSNLKFNVFPFSKFDEYDLKIVVDPVNPNSGFSPLGWNKIDDNIDSHVTIGNNIVAQDYLSKYTFNGGKKLEYDGTNCYRVDDCENKYNRDIALSTMFYFGNLLHDYYYNLGFDEKQGNFQTNNFGKGGYGNDPVILNYLNIEDCDTDEKLKEKRCEFMNYAFTTTPRDGLPAMIYLPVFKDNSDGHFFSSGISNHVVIHEYTHAVTRRLYGGPNFDCHVFGDTTETQSLLEGYSDFFSFAFQFNKNSNNTRNTYLRLDNILNRSNIISSKQDYKYSRLNIIRDTDVSYYKGSDIWRLMLHDAFWNIVENFSSTDDYLHVYDEDEPIPGNIIFLRTILKSLSIQGCSPTFITARNSIIKALEKNLYVNDNKKYICLVWKAFADRGLGFNAAPALHKNNQYIYVDNFDLPEDCIKELN